MNDKQKQKKKYFDKLIRNAKKEKKTSAQIHIELTDKKDKDYLLIKDDYKRRGYKVTEAFYGTKDERYKMVNGIRKLVVLSDKQWVVLTVTWGPEEN